MKLLLFLFHLLIYFSSFTFIFVLPLNYASDTLLLVSLFSLGAKSLSDSSVSEGPQRPCWTPACKVAVIEGEELAGEAPPTSESDAQAVKISCRSDGLRVRSLKELCVHQMPSYTRILEIHNTSISELEPSSFASLIHLRKIDLRRNKISTIAPLAFKGLSSLKRLDLSYNNISSLNESQVRGLNELVRMKIGHNPLRTLHSSLEIALPSLRAIELGDTLLECDCRLAWILQSYGNVDEGPSQEPHSQESQSLGSRTLKPLGGMEIPSDDAINIGHRKKRPLRLLGGASCQSPKEFGGMKLKKLTPTQMVCEDSNTSAVSIMEIEPGLDQVVFAGDSLKLRCRVTGFGSPPSRVWWRWGQREGDNIREVVPQGTHENGHTYKDITIKTSLQKDSTESFVHIPELSWDHSGEWSCVVEGNGKNSSRSLSVYVIHHDTRYCPVNVTTNNKGTYSWPRTVASVRVDLPCQGVSPHHLHSHSSSWPSLSLSSSRATWRAKHSCGADGTWHSLDTSQCPYVSEATRILEHFAATNISATGSSLAESARTLRNFTGQGNVYGDPVDVSFLAHTVRQYVELTSKAVHAHPTAEVLVDIISSSLAATKELLKSAEILHRSCRSLLSSLWRLADAIPTLTRAATPQLHLYQVGVRNHAFSGVSCVWFRKNRHAVERHFRCNTNNYSLFYTIEEEVTDARIRIPAHLFSTFAPLSNFSIEDESTNKTWERDISLLRLQFFVYDSDKLFPSGGIDSWQVTSPVIGVRLNDGAEITTDDVYVTLRSPIYSQNIAPSVWEPGEGNEDGQWIKGKCRIIRVVNSLVVFKCSQLGHFGLLQDMAAFEGSHNQRGAEFRLCPPGVYVGSTVCCVFLMASIATWCVHHDRIGTMSKNKHSFLNTWIALLFLVALFTVGIYQTEGPRICQAIGVLLHYLTTCVLLWIIVSVTNLYKKVIKVLRPPLPTDEPPPDLPLPPKPMLRFYLVGWGIALIVCGISAAVNLRYYGTFSYCFLAWHPSMSAFYAPSAVLVFILAAFFLLTQCVLNTSHAGYSEATGNTETTELELLDTASPASENPPSGGQPEDELSIASQTSSLSLTDAQHSPMTQLRAHAVTLILFMLTWASAAITAAAPFASVIPFHSSIFSVMYAVCASSLGIFTFVFFCVSRSDVVEAWKELWSSSSCSSPVREDETQLTVANNVSSCSSVPRGVQSTPTNNQLLIPTSTSPCVAPSVRSLDSSNTHQTNKSSSISHHASNKAETLNKTSNSHALHSLNLSSLSESAAFAPEMFYNPKQTGVAKRFFQKQRLKQLMKQNNLEMNRADSDCNSSTVYKPRFKATHNLRAEADVGVFDTSYLGLPNKINNTNIHVDSMYTGTKHATKVLTPELLCVFGPPRDTCSIVSSTENDQHQWPMTFQHHCVSNPVFFHPKHLNVSRGAFTDPGKESGEQRISPLIFQDIVTTAVPVCSLDPKSPEGKCRKTPGRSHRAPRPLRMRRKRSRSRGSGREELNWSEDEPITAAVPKDSETPAFFSSGELSTFPLSNSTKPTSPLSFSPLSHSSSPLPPSLPSAMYNSPSCLSPSPPHLLPSISSPPCTQLEWMHLLNKRRPCDSQECLPGENTSSYPVAGIRDSFYASCSEGESTEGVVDGETTSWEKALERRVIQRESEGPLCDDSFDGESVGGCSMAPGADPSPPPSLPVSDSPFDSPLHKFQQTTPDTLSLDSGSLLSPLRSQFSSMDNPSLLNLPSPSSESLHSPVTPTLTPTLSTPVNPPVSPASPMGSSLENDLDTLGSPSEIMKKAEAKADSHSSHEGTFDSSIDTVFHRGGDSSPPSDAVSPMSSLTRDGQSHLSPLRESEVRPGAEGQAREADVKMGTTHHSNTSSSPEINLSEHESTSSRETDV